MSSITSNTLTNPLDVIRTRMQVSYKKSASYSTMSKTNVKRYQIPLSCMNLYKRAFDSKSNMLVSLKISKQKETFLVVTKTLWEQEKMNFFFKGLTARLAFTSLSSLLVILSYETVKRNSLKKEFT
jgi:hypothetical protein